MKKTEVQNPNAQLPRRSFLDQIAQGGATLRRPSVERTVSPRAEELIAEKAKKASVAEEFANAIKQKRAGQDEDTSTRSISAELDDPAKNISAPNRIKRKSGVFKPFDNDSTTTPATEAIVATPFNFASVLGRRISEVNITPRTSPVEEESAFDTEPTPTPATSVQSKSAQVIKPQVMAKPKIIQPAKPVAKISSVDLAAVESKQRRLSAALFASINRAPIEQEEVAPVVAAPVQTAKPIANSIDLEAAKKEHRRLSAAIFASINRAPVEQEEVAPVVTEVTANVEQQDHAVMLSRKQEEADAAYARQLQAEEQRANAEMLVRRQEEADAEYARKLQAEERLARVREEQKLSAERTRKMQEAADRERVVLERHVAEQQKEATINNLLWQLNGAVTVAAKSEANILVRVNNICKVIRDLADQDVDLGVIHCTIVQALKDILADGSLNNQTTSFRGYILQHFSLIEGPRVERFVMALTDNIIFRATSNQLMNPLNGEAQLVMSNPKLHNSRSW